VRRFSHAASSTGSEAKSSAARIGASDTYY
jgi:hypothetical protein